MKLLPMIGLLKKIYEICTDKNDNNGYLAVKYTRLFTNDICLYCNVYQ